jgi:hypothetical protein
MFAHSENRRKPLIPFSKIQQHKYLFFVLYDLWMGVVTWLLYETFFTSRPLFSLRSLFYLVLLLWGHCFVAVFIYEKMRKRHENKGEI